MSLSKYLVNYLSDSESGEISSDEEEPVKVAPQWFPAGSLLFSVHLSASLASATPCRAVLFDSVDKNADNCYNVSTGRFTASVQGTFIFFLTITSTERLLASLCFIHKFHPVSQSKVREREQLLYGFYTKTIAVVLDLDKEDEIWILNITKSDDVSHMREPYYTTFAGGLIESTKPS